MIDRLIDLAGVWLVRGYVAYGIALLFLPTLTFAYAILTAVLGWRLLRPAPPRAAPNGRPRRIRWLRLFLELVFGLLNPVFYLAVLAPAWPWLRWGPDWWQTLLTVTAWTLLVLFWMTRFFGGALDADSRLVRTGTRALLGAALGCLATYAVKDLFLASQTMGPTAPVISVVLAILRIAPLYVVPALLLWHYWRAGSTSRLAASGSDAWHGLFLLRSRPARALVAGVVAIAVLTVAGALYRRSDGAVRRLVTAHRDDIQRAAARYDVDPRLIASIVYVTHRDQLSPFRDGLERLVMSAWVQDQLDQYGGNAIMLDRPLDISVGIAQIKPRTALTATLLASGLSPEDLPRPYSLAYRIAEPIGDGWTATPAFAPIMPPMVSVPGGRDSIAAALLRADTNLGMCALILSLYQRQWEAANPFWSIRTRPEILATLYQIGFAKSKPHASPRSNAFGARVRQVYEMEWIAALFGK